MHGKAEMGILDCYINLLALFQGGWDEVEGRGTGILCSRGLAGEAGGEHDTLLSP